MIFFGPVFDLDQTMTKEEIKKQIIEATRAGDLNGVKKALAAGADANEKDYCAKRRGKRLGTTLLHHAVNLGREDICETLLDAGADVDGTNDDRLRPIHLAVRNDNGKMVSLLISRGADILKADCGWERCLLHSAAEIGSVSACIALLAAHADVGARDFCGATPLHLAVSRPPNDGRFTEEVLRVLLDAGADLDARDISDQTPLHHAATWPWRDACAALISAGANSSAVDKWGKTPLDGPTLAEIEGEILNSQVAH